MATRGRAPSKPYDANVITLLVNTISTPCLVIDMLTRPGPHHPRAGADGAGLGPVPGAAADLAGWGMTRAMGLPARTYVPPLVWSNGGNMGLPLCLFAFGELGLGLAIAWFAVSSVSNYTIGQAIAAGGITFREVVRMPMTWAILAAVVMIATGLRLPTVAQRAVGLLGALRCPSCCCRWATRSPRCASPPTIAASRFRWRGWSAASPSAGSSRWCWASKARRAASSSSRAGCRRRCSNYLFAVRYGNDPQEAASIVVISTVFSIVALPLFLLSVM